MPFKRPIVETTIGANEDLVTPPTSEEIKLIEAKASATAIRKAQERAASKEKSLSQTIAENMREWHSDPWAMIKSGVIWTLDQVDLSNPIKRFPQYPWLEFVVREWEKEKLLSIPKSRRMMLTWLTIYLHLWLAMWHPGVAAFLVSESERKSADMIEKADFIFRHIPDQVMLKPKMRRKHCLIEFPGLDSYIMGIPEGENQLRQYTATALLFDEWAFWERPMESLAAAKPCIMGGGRLTLISTPGKEAFYDLCFDRRM